MSQERRKNPRVAIAADVDLSSGDNFFTGRTRDISVGGLFLDIDVGLPIGAQVGVRLKGGASVFSVHCEVMWALDDDDGRVRGLGLQFVELAPDARAAIEAFMTSRAPLLVDMEPPSDAP